MAEMRFNADGLFQVNAHHRAKGSWRDLCYGCDRSRRGPYHHCVPEHSYVVGSHSRFGWGDLALLFARAAAADAKQERRVAPNCAVPRVE